MIRIGLHIIETWKAHREKYEEMGEMCENIEMEDDHIVKFLCEILADDLPILDRAIDDALDWKGAPRIVKPILERYDGEVASTGAKLMRYTLQTIRDRRAAQGRRPTLGQLRREMRRHAVVSVEAQLDDTIIDAPTRAPVSPPDMLPPGAE